MEDKRLETNHPLPPKHSKSGPMFNPNPKTLIFTFCSLQAFVTDKRHSNTWIENHFRNAATHSDHLKYDQKIHQAAKEPSPISSAKQPLIASLTLGRHRSTNSTRGPRSMLGFLAPSHQFLKNVLLFFSFWCISKCDRFLKSVLSFFKRQLNFQK